MKDEIFSLGSVTKNVALSTKSNCFYFIFGIIACFEFFLLPILYFYLTVQNSFITLNIVKKMKTIREIRSTLKNISNSPSILLEVGILSEFSVCSSTSLEILWSNHCLFYFIYLFFLIFKSSILFGFQQTDRKISTPFQYNKFLNKTPHIETNRKLIY